MGNYSTAYGKPVDQINFGAVRFAPVLPRPPGGRHDNSRDKNINKESHDDNHGGCAGEVVAWKGDGVVLYFGIRVGVGEKRG